MANKIGWILAILLGGGLFVLILFKVLVAHPDGPTRATLAKGVLDARQIETPISSVIGYDQTEPGNAGEDYANTIAFLKANEEEFKKIYDNLFRTDRNTLTLAELDKLNQAYELLKPALKKKQMQYTWVYTPKEFKVSSRPEALRDFMGLVINDRCEEFRLEQLLETLANHYYRTNNNDKLMEISRAILVMGRHMSDEDIRSMMTLAGLDTQANACQKLEVVTSNTSNEELRKNASAYRENCETILYYYVPKGELVWTLKKRDDGKGFGPHAGDLFNIIEHDKSRAWRIDGILALGILKYGQKGHRGNMKKAEELMAEYAASSDPYFKAAAKMAKEATNKQIEQWANE